MIHLRFYHFLPFASDFLRPFVKTQVLNSLGIDFSNHYGDDSNELPVPAVFVIHQNSKVVFAHTEGGDFRNRVEIADILAALN